MLRKPSSIGAQKPHNVNIKNKASKWKQGNKETRKQNEKIIILKNNSTKVVVGAYLSRNKKKNQKKAGYIYIYITYHELVSEK